MADFQTLRFEQTDGVATITLNRPKAANGLNSQMGVDLMEAAIACDENPAIRAVVLTGEGKMFSAGGDLKEFAGFGDEISAKIKVLTTHLHAAISRFSRMEKPLIVAVNGMAAGAGFSMAVSGDYVFASQSAKFTMAYTAAGLSPDGSSSYFLPRLIGMRKTQELMLTNRRLTAEEALEWGLVNEVVADDELADSALEFAKTLAAGPTKAYGQVKKLLLTSFDNSLETQMEQEARGIAAMTQTADGKEGIASFLEKRKPSYKGA